MKSKESQLKKLVIFSVVNLLTFNLIVVLKLMLLLIERYFLMAVRFFL